MTSPSTTEREGREKEGEMLALLLLHQQQPKMATWSCLSSAGIKKCSNHCSAHMCNLPLECPICHPLPPAPLSPSSTLLQFATELRWQITTTTTTITSCSSSSNKTATMSPALCHLIALSSPKSIQQLRMRYAMVYGICDILVQWRIRRLAMQRQAGVQVKPSKPWHKHIVAAKANKQQSPTNTLQLLRVTNFVPFCR